MLGFIQQEIYTKSNKVYTAPKGRYTVYAPQKHGGKILGTAETLEDAVNIGVVRGCRNPICRCEKYRITDQKLNTNRIDKMFFDEHKGEHFARKKFNKNCKAHYKPKSNKKDDNSDK